MLTLDRLRNPTNAECAVFDLAAVDLACTEGLPGSENLDIPYCLGWIDNAAAWVRRQTEATIAKFAGNPDEYDNSEGIFRVVAMMHVLRGGLGVHYNQERIDDPDEFSDSRDDFIHGIIAGHGGTCASLPVLFAAVGRRLGYPLKLVTTAHHQFTRWDDPLGERFNFEINNTGLNTHPDEHYLTWPIDIRDMNWRTASKFLRSLNPREEVAHLWAKRSHILRANGRLREAVDCLATACSIVTDDCLLDSCLLTVIKLRREALKPRIPPETPKLRIYFPPQRRYPGLPIEVEREIISLEVVEDLLNEPHPVTDFVIRRVLS